MYQVYGYMGNISILFLTPLFDCAGTSPSVSSAEEIEEVEQEVQYGAV